jgi:hypothetical protein
VLEPGPDVLGLGAAFGHLLLLLTGDRQHVVLDVHLHVLRAEAGKLGHHLDGVLGLAHVHHRHPGADDAVRLTEEPVEHPIDLAPRREQIVPVGRDIRPPESRESHTYLLAKHG